MSKIDQGVLIFNEWFESAKGLSGLEFKKLFLAMYDYQINGKEPPSFTAKGETLAKVVFPCLEKRVKGAMYAKHGSQQAANVEGLENSPEPARVPAGVKSPIPSAKEEKSKEKKNNYSFRANARGGKAARSEKDEFFDEFFEAAVKRALGENT